MWARLQHSCHVLHTTENWTHTFLMIGQKVSSERTGGTCASIYNGEKCTVQGGRRGRVCVRGGGWRRERPRTNIPDEIPATTVDHVLVRGMTMREAGHSPTQFEQVICGVLSRLDPAHNRCLARENISCDMDEVLWPNPCTKMLQNKSQLQRLCSNVVCVSVWVCFSFSKVLNVENTL